MLQNQDVAQGSGRYEHWLAVLDAYGAQFLILDTQRDGDLLQAVRSQPGWIVDFKDEGVVLFTRADTGRIQYNRTRIAA